MMQGCKRISLYSFLLLLILIPLSTGLGSGGKAQASAAASGAVNQAFTQASQESGVPVELLKAICYMEGRLSNHKGIASLDGGYGCMHLLKNKRVDVLDQAAQELGVSADSLINDEATNIRGGAAILRDDAKALSSGTLPQALAGWYGVVASYSQELVKSTALMYADATFKILNAGFSGVADDGETVTLAAQGVTPDTATANGVKQSSGTTLPKGCVDDGKTDYPGAIDCILNPPDFDCNLLPGATVPCSYIGANRPTDFPVNYVDIHDIEGSVVDALAAFQNVTNQISVHYIVDTDGTVYQLVHDKDIAFHIGNFWYNQRSVGIEHAGFDVTGYEWYNAAEYLGSAKLTAYLLKKYHIPLDRDHVMAHGTTPSPILGTSPNHVDPGPYWLWDYYFGLIHLQGVPFAPTYLIPRTVTLHPLLTDTFPLGPCGTETQANFNFFMLYQGPSTASGLIPNASNGADITDETYNVEAGITYNYLDKVIDPAGTGDTLYEIWYGEADQVNSGEPYPANQFADAHLAWLAVPPGVVTLGSSGGKVVGLKLDNAKIYGRPITADTNVIGGAPGNATFFSAYTVIEMGTSNLWYEINYNHRQAWVPATEVQVVNG